MLANLIAFASLLRAVLAVGRTTPPSGAITVGSGQTYSTIQAAVNSLSTTSTAAQSIFIYAGTYTEQVYIPARSAALAIYGSTKNTSSYTSNQVTITHSLSLGSATSDDATGTVRNWAANSKIYNINIENTFGKSNTNGQAIALSAAAGNQGYYGVALSSYQDTLLAENGAQVYAACYIEGAVDFIFGQAGQVWIDNAQIAISAPSGGTITASGRKSSTSNSYYVINKSNVLAATSSTASTFTAPAVGSAYLGRPWSQYARVIFQGTVLSDVINGAGWEVWSKSEPNTEHVTLAEFGNTGPGASGTRASFARKLSAAVAIGTVLGSGYANWVDVSYLST